MKLTIALRRLVSGSKYRDMRFGWRVPDNTIPLTYVNYKKYFSVVLLALVDSD
ncbi:hypothetical protein DPMN_147800 [Dreissena polymorpha]|uniref:Uncharacterized protein n=1 Tax=Dreissena polymorpha TaxID=45954 RepID=A0A9D4J399_DREPO|nr:hypothetical protein DPMN_147800 [Dreissena polymorpha]